MLQRWNKIDVFFFIEDKESLKSIIIFGNDITNNRKQRFDSEPV